MKVFLFLLLVFIFVGLEFDVVQSGTMVTGAVFCDQCKDGQVSMFDYPLSGMKVSMVCSGSDGKMTTVGKDTTNMFGNYGITFDGTPDLSTCFAQISPNSNVDPSNKCGAIPGSPKSVKLMFSMFDMAMYTVDPLISQPAQPMSSCSTPSSPPTSPSPVTLPPPTSSNPPPMGPIVPVTPSAPPKAPAPAFQLPPMIPLPPAPFLRSSACSYDYWMKAEYKCYWRAVKPETSVAEVFGPLAAQKYGSDITLYASLQGKGDPYKTLLRESVTALLNSWNSMRFPYFAPQVLHHFNKALMSDSTSSVLQTALKFRRVNTGSPCKFETCKS
ncbi:protodermal factor 1-like [Amaranthus tricolor]|uniref:protodermal factor 1-like n=1 Tax=Amaranthus tricolor TaxID=29722 RepID=UPI002583A967|nr:protodermal factor 1-like [Amaranthus tricolor]